MSMCFVQLLIYLDDLFRLDKIQGTLIVNKK